ncbi:MAG: translation initiation factor IF-3 [Chloroflexi bacterium]|nr:translation initiation factor IF-3 [Chloroflexota bacterium]
MYKRGRTISAREHRLNDEIRVREVRLIDETGKQLGIYPIREALRLAEDHGVDLVEIAPNAKPPVCRLLDYSKFIYERNKREREARRTQKQIDIKEIRLRPKTAEHDMLTKVRQAREFLSEGAKVRVRIRFRGREVTHQEIARDLLAKMAEALADASIVEQRPAMDAMTMLMILAPSGKIEKKASQPEEPTSA